MRARALGPSALAACFSASLVACGGGAPLLHPARTLPTGDMRLTSGVAAHVTPGSLGDDLARAREISATDPRAPGPPGTSPEYAKGALVAASVAPGLAPVVAARVGVGARYEGGLTYTGRGARVDMRRSFDGGPYSLSMGLGASAALYGDQQGTELAGVDLASLRGYGADVPVLVGWESAGGIYKLWAGARGGFERTRIATVTSEPKDLGPGFGPMRLEADRFHAGGLVGFATGFHHVHVALELSAAYQVVSGTFNANDVTVRGLTLSPASAVWITF